MIRPEAFVEAARRHGFGFWSGVPCSYFAALVDTLRAAGGPTYVTAANEGDAVAMAAGASLAGTRGVALMQNSGLGNAVSPLTSLAETSGLPVLLVVTWRGEPGGAPDEPQHAHMGAITTRLLDTLGIPWRIFPESTDTLEANLRDAVATMDATSRPFAFVMRKGAFPDASGPGEHGQPDLRARPSRAEVVDVVTSLTDPASSRALVVSTTGFTSRALFARADRPNHFYVVGAMGCASSVALGLALGRPDRKVVVLDGDGAVLMRMGALATLGAASPPNIVHLVLDNGSHESTGGQATATATTDLAACARACGYAAVEDVRDADHLRDVLGAALGGRATGPTFVHVRTRKGTDALPRPRVTPVDVARRFREHVAHGVASPEGSAHGKGPT
ncbi:MAG: phosphonopyruvate decarboxylase [Polyangiaceae bacterium]